MTQQHRIEALTGIVGERRVQVVLDIVNDGQPDRESLLDLCNYLDQWILMDIIEAYHLGRSILSHQEV